MPELRAIAADLLFPDGPVALAEGSVLVVEIARRCLTWVLPNAARRSSRPRAAGPNGAAIGPDGHYYVCNNDGFESC